MSRKSYTTFFGEDMRQHIDMERIPFDQAIPTDWDML